MNNIIYYKIEFDINQFEFWGGAKDRIDKATDEQIELITKRITECFDCLDEIPTDTQINDLVWFDCDDVFYPDEDESENKGL